MAVSTSFCGQMETERERILQRRSSMSAHKVRPLYTTPLLGIIIRYKCTVQMICISATDEVCNNFVCS